MDRTTERIDTALVTAAAGRTSAVDLVRIGCLTWIRLAVDPVVQQIMLIDAPTVLGEQGYATLADVPFPIDVVDVFRRSDAAGEFADQAVKVGAKAVWFQLGVIDEDAIRRTRRAGVRMVMDTCPAIEWSAR